MFKKTSVILIAIVSIIFSSCSSDYKAEVKSNTEWSGAFGNRTVDGSGNTTVELPDDYPQCCVVQKQTKEGYLKERVIAEGGWILGPDDSDWVETTAEYGVVSVCSEE